MCGLDKDYCVTMDSSLPKQTVPVAVARHAKRRLPVPSMTGLTPRQPRASVVRSAVTYTHTRRHVCTHTHTHTHTSTYAHTRLCKHALMHSHSRTHTHTHTRFSCHTRTHIPVNQAFILFLGKLDHSETFPDCFFNNKKHRIITLMVMS